MTKEQILYEDKDIIVCFKPAGIAVQTSKVGQRDMVSEITNYCAQEKCGRDIYVGCVHRLDQPVEGVLVFARNRKSAGALSRQIAENRMEKYYYAVVSAPETAEKAKPEAGKETGGIHKVTLTDYLLKDNQTNMSRVVPAGSKGAKEAVLEYEILGRKELLWENFSGKPFDGENAAAIALIRVHLITGRHHQIRVQMSHAGMSLLGDYKYADERSKKLSGAMGQKNIALCAYGLNFAHPATGKKLSFRIEPKGGIFQYFAG